MTVLTTETSKASENEMTTTRGDIDRVSTVSTQESTNDVSNAGSSGGGLDTLTLAVLAGAAVVIVLLLCAIVCLVRKRNKKKVSVSDADGVEMQAIEPGMGTEAEKVRVLAHAAPPGNQTWQPVPTGMVQMPMQMQMQMQNANAQWVIQQQQQAIVRANRPTPDESDEDTDPEADQLFGSYAPEGESRHTTRQTEGRASTTRNTPH
eukprot:CAMPEP_0202706042 /NCGR_PEP_ID=MMETSP1385-20130828/18521_1 /ASSEMBLY_ACC=CAM_ASM_000861 /TAXON_ID=933848 /ORGANISM="Elphidium margaritaceum" /LENGTH=205 /DNA_ID=CAMNT_0049364415 /DNA_START=48 /DNA_END=665 /DNA_ORIENTATION=+